MKDMLIALNEAINLEVEGELIYKEIAEQSTDDFVRMTFKGLADDEVRHAKIIKDFAESIKKDKAFDMKQLDAIKDNRPSRIFGTSIKKFKDKAKHDAKALKPFDTAIDLEKRSIEFYTGRLDKAVLDETKELFLFLIAQEKMHLTSLEKAKDFLKNPEHSYLEMEEWIMDGGM